jgi:hypothetical protein
MGYVNSQKGSCETKHYQSTCLFPFLYGKERRRSVVTVITIDYERWYLGLGEVGEVGEVLQGGGGSVCRVVCFMCGMRCVDACCFCWITPKSIFYTLLYCQTTYQHQPPSTRTSCMFHSCTGILYRLHRVKWQRPVISPYCTGMHHASIKNYKWPLRLLVI